jgi:precorrin-2 dehydrogenase / sirohydrochlorin ferrochelatase
VSGYPIILEGTRIKALIVGGGPVAARKARALIESGASVRVASPQLSPEMQSLVESGSVVWTRADYNESMIGDASLVFAATDSEDVNSKVASDSRSRGVPVNIASDASHGDFCTPATHRDGPVLVAVFAGGVPAVARRIRDVVRQSTGIGLSSAVSRLIHLRSELLAQGADQRWQDASRELIGEDFLDSIDNGEFERRLRRWG